MRKSIAIYRRRISPVRRSPCTPRCILDTEVLRFLLDAGADPTIGREVHRDVAFGIIDLPVQRLRGHILEMAVNLGAAEAVDLLVSHGARPEHGVTLHSLIRRRPDPAAAKVMDEEHREELCRETPWLAPGPRGSKRRARV